MLEGFLSTGNVMQMDGYRQTSEAIEGSVYVRKCRDTKVERKPAPKFIGFRSIVANKIERALRA
jgi:hypothetical protein